MRVVICGAGIAGLTLAWWLRRDGHDVTIVEHSPTMRTEGYMLDFFGSGWDVAERMGLLGELERIHYPIASLVFSRDGGKGESSISYPRLRRLFGGRHFNFMRGDLERVLFDALDDAVDLRFSTTVDSFSEEGNAVRVRLSDGSEVSCALLVGADGVHSKVRRLAFGDTGDPTRFLGFHAAAYVIEDASVRDATPNAFLTMTLPKRQAGIYPIRGDKLATFFVYDQDLHPSGTPGAGESLRHVYGDFGWVVPELFEHLPTDDDVYFDAVCQVVLDRWSRGRVALAGDACHAVSLLAGQGASMAMGGAWALATELAAGGSVVDALERYEKRVRPAIEKKQAAGRRMAKWFVPTTSRRIAFRDLMLWISTSPGMSWMLRGTVSGDSIVR